MTIAHRQHRYQTALHLRRMAYALAESGVGNTWRACRLLALGGVAEALGAQDHEHYQREMAAAMDYRRHEQRERIRRVDLCHARGDVPAAVRA